MGAATGVIGWLDRRLYPDYGDSWDEARFRQLVLRYLNPSMEVLDVGAGAGVKSHLDLRSEARRIVGVDLDSRVLSNPHLHAAQVAPAEALPFPSMSFDLAICHNVLEHLADPRAALSEMRRVLKPGGRLLIKTPNRYHYVPLIAALTPVAFHRWVNERRGRARRDTFPTDYRANSVGALTALCRVSGLQVRELDLWEGRPEYLRWHPLPYLLGWAYERAVNSTERLRQLRAVLVAVLQR